MPSTIKYYWNIGSQPARAVKALLEIGKISHQAIFVDILKNQTRSESFLKKNPFGQIPYLEDGDLKVSESNAIMVYLCEKYESIPKHYYGQTPVQRAKVNKYLSWYQSSFRPALMKIIHIKVYGFYKGNIAFYDHQIISAKREMFQMLQRFDKLLQIEKTPYICGENPSIADLLFYFQVTNLIYYGQSHEKYKNITQWFKKVYAIPQVKVITHEWFRDAMNFKKLLDSLQPVSSKL